MIFPFRNPRPWPTAIFVVGATRDPARACPSRAQHARGTFPLACSRCCRTVCRCGPFLCRRSTEKETPFGPFRFTSAIYFIYNEAGKPDVTCRSKFPSRKPIRHLSGGGDRRREMTVKVGISSLNFQFTICSIHSEITLFEEKQDDHRAIETWIDMIVDAVFGDEECAGA
nr:hypothetical protein Iba_chr09bCG1930 [Ipomoea batatas]